jgi:phosphate uptake regulator
MQIVWDKEVIEKMRSSQTIVELETFQIGGKPVTTYCVIPAEKLLSELNNLDALTDLHKEFLKAFADHNVTLCESISTQLIGRFGGELDTFYQEIIKRLKTTLK